MGTPATTAAAFAARHGYTFEQAERYSVLHVPEIEPTVLDHLAAEAGQAAGADYRVVTWTDRCPDEWIDDWAALARLRPGTRRIHTWNAEENAHMLAINVALGFRPTGVVALWQRRLDPPTP